MEDITDEDYTPAKKVCKNFVTKKFRRISWFASSKRCIIVRDVFDHFRNICLKIYELGSAKFISVPGLAWQSALEKTKVRLDLLTNIDMLLMVKKVLEEEYVTLK